MLYKVNVAQFQAQFRVNRIFLKWVIHFVTLTETKHISYTFAAN